MLCLPLGYYNPSRLAGCGGLTSLDSRFLVPTGLTVSPLESQQTPAKVTVGQQQSCRGFCDPRSLLQTAYGGKQLQHSLPQNVVFALHFYMGIMYCTPNMCSAQYEAQGRGRHRGSCPGEDYNLMEEKKQLQVK